jgi:hypothetical protein
MIFFSDKPEKNGARVAARLRKELGMAAPPAFETEVEGTAFRPKSIGASLRATFADISQRVPAIRPMYTFHFAFETPRMFWLDVSVINVGGISVVGDLCYLARLPGRIAADAHRRRRRPRQREDHPPLQVPRRPGGRRPAERRARPRQAREPPAARQLHPA